MARPAAVTLHDIAREAQVAISTASRALANPDRVSRATREHVQAVARRLGYQQARPTSAMLALLVHDITNPYNFGLIRGAEAQARAGGYTLIIGDTQTSAEFEATHAERLGSAVDGLILGGSRQSPAQLRQLQQQRPVVLFNREEPGFPSVVTDSVDGSRQIVEHLVALGHRRLAYLSGPRELWSEGQRWHGLEVAADNAGATITRLGPFLPTLDQGAAAADIGLSNQATALIAFNDLLAIGVLQRLEKRQVAVPDQLSVVGYDDIFGADFCHPPLTTVAAPVENAGRLLVDLVLGAAAERAQSGASPPAEPTTARPTARLTLPTQLRVRESTGPAAITD